MIPFILQKQKQAVALKVKCVDTVFEEAIVTMLLYFLVFMSVASYLHEKTVTLIL